MIDGQLPDALNEVDDRPCLSHRRRLLFLLRTPSAPYVQKFTKLQHHVRAAVPQIIIFPRKDYKLAHLSTTNIMKLGSLA
eukprot:UN22700